MHDDRTPDAQPDDATSDEGAELLDLLHTLMHTLRRESVADDIAPGQMRFLRTLHRAGGTARPGELATALNLAPRSVTTKVDLAEAAGLVERRPDPTDRRATVVALTDRGTAVLAQVSADRTRGMSARLSRLAPADRTRLLTLVRRLTDE
ncbi:MAG: MarR family transcriptional regulator [Micrococcales bacterium]|nr:MarR family transcriptional regulator [Micrococcales bacterium]